MKIQQKQYSKPRISQEKYQWVKDLTCEGCGISSIGRLLNIAKSSVQRIIERKGREIAIPKYEEENQNYEMDELRTYCENKKNESWVMYAINKTTGKVIDFYVGRMTKENINKVVQSVLKLNRSCPIRYFSVQHRNKNLFIPVIHIKNNYKRVEFIS